MLGVKEYEKKYINSCRENIKSLMAAYKKINDPKLKEFEPLFLNNMLVALDAFFVHRVRAQEGKDGNPLNEVRMLRQSILTNGGKLATDKTIRYKAAGSILKLNIADEIKPYLQIFEISAKAFFNEIEKKYT